MSPEGSVSVSPLNMVFERGQDVTFNCTAQGGPILVAGVVLVAVVVLVAGVVLVQ